MKKKSNIVRALLVFLAISPSSKAAIYSPATGPNTGAPVIYAFKPSDVIFPGFVQTDLRQRPDDNRGFSGFVEEVRNAVNSARGGASLTNRAEAASLADRRTGSQSPYATYEASIPIKLEPNSRTGDKKEIYLGVSVKQIVSEIPPAGTAILERSKNGATENRAWGGGSSSGSVRGRSLSSSSSGWLSGGFLSTGGATGLSGFGFDLQPMSFPADQGNGAYVNTGSGDVEVTKGLKALRRIVLDLVFNPFVYFGGLIVAVFMFMARFRSA